MSDSPVHPAGWSRRTVPTAVGPLAVWERGRGAAVMLRHGIFFDHTLWAAHADALASTHRVIVVDGPGHGASGDPGRPYAIADDATATLQILDALHVDAAALVGHSWGGMSAVRAALVAPHRVTALALIDTPLEPSSALGRVRYRALRAMVIAMGAPGWYGTQVARAMFSDESRRRDPSLTSDLQRQLSTASRDALARAMDAVLIRPDTVLERMGGLEQPIFVLAGDEDYVLPASTTDALRRSVPHAVIETLPGKHVLPLEQPDGTLRVIRSALAASEDAVEASTGLKDRAGVASVTD